MALAPTPEFSENQGTTYERKMAPDRGGRREGPLRFEEGIVTDTDVPTDFGVGIAQGNPAPGRPNHNQKVDTKYADETMRERAHPGSAAWTEAPTFLGEFAHGSQSGYGQLEYEQVDRSGTRYQRRDASVIEG